MPADDGDYTRLLDFARLSIVCDTFVQLKQLLSFFLTSGCGGRFSACRLKDRFTRGWDPEQSGGNRDLLINGWLKLGGGRSFIVEIQLHVRSLFILKGDLHTLYAGARVLGAMDDMMIAHEGVLTDAVLEKTKRGVLRKLGIAGAPVTSEGRGELIKILQKEPCPLLVLDATSCTCDEGAAFAGMSLADVLLPSTGTLACRRLRELKLTKVGLCGELPEDLRQLNELRDLRLGYNALSGPIPEWIGELTALRMLAMGGNKLTGAIPEALGRCTELGTLALDRNQLTGTSARALHKAANPLAN